MRIDINPSLCRFERVNFNSLIRTKEIKWSNFLSILKLNFVASAPGLQRQLGILRDGQLLGGRGGGRGSSGAPGRGQGRRGQGAAGA